MGPDHGPFAGGPTTQGVGVRNISARLQTGGPRPTVNGGPRPVAEGIVRYPAARCGSTVTLSVRERRDDKPSKLPGEGQGVFFIRSRRPTARRQASGAATSTRRHAAAARQVVRRRGATPPRSHPLSVSGRHRRRRGHVTSCRFPRLLASAPPPAVTRSRETSQAGRSGSGSQTEEGEKKGVRSRWLSSEMARGVVGFGMMPEHDAARRRPVPRV